MKTKLLMAAAAASLMAMTGCASTSSQDLGLATGAVVGGVAGNAIGGGSALGTVGGAVAGGLVGNELGRRQDENARRRY